MTDDAPYAVSASAPRRATLRWATGIAGIAFALLWTVGLLTKDQWGWSQLLFWIPSPVAAAAALGAAFALWRIRSASARRGAAVACLLCVTGIAMSLARDVGWSHWPAAAPSDAVCVAHWNARAPGVRATDFGRALTSLDADVYFISNPGHMTRASVAPTWVPEGFSVYDGWGFSIVSRLRVESSQVLAFAAVAGQRDYWIASVNVVTRAGARVHMLVFDLPSSPWLARSSVREWIAESLALYPELPAPDLVLGDFNNLPNSRFFGLLPPTSEPSAGECVGWQPTFPRAFPLWHLDAMRVGHAWKFEAYETVNLGLGMHCAQRAMITPRR